MAVMKIKAFGFPRINHFNLTAQLPIVIPRNDNRLAARRQIPQKFGRFHRRCFIVNKVAKDNQPARLIFIDQLHQALRDRGHPPHRHETTGRALAEFVTEMQIGYGEPAFRLVEEREAPIEQDFIGDERLIRA